MIITTKPMANNDKPKKTIVFGGLRNYSVAKMLHATHRVSGIIVDSQSGVVNIVIEQGTNVYQHNMSMEHAQSIGFINLDALAPYCK